MCENDLQQVQHLFDEALATLPEDRAAFLNTACNDATIRSKVESLLAHHDKADDTFMRVPESDACFSLRGIADGPDPRIGATIGGYHIENVIADGGMGTVYLARQKQPDRHVAMKVMHTDIPSRSALRRFQYESQILARLRHPGIAQAYEAGIHSDVDSPTHSIPFFVMEYIPDARPITQYANELGLTVRERLSLFIQVCEAVQHGHQKGIIHRDLKPGNILVTDDQSRDRDQGDDKDQSRDRKGAVGVQTCGPAIIKSESSVDSHDPYSTSKPLVKIIDFGIARSTDSDVAVTTMKTDVGQLIGTMQYMSPEQCAADPDDLDTRSDVYALGVVLYELLCGALPYDVSGTTIMGAARMICDAPPTPPHTITGRDTGIPAVKRDLEMTVLKALKKNREERYESAAALSADVRRYLRGEPTEARPPTAWTRVLRWASRKPFVATTTISIVIGLAILGGAWLATWYANNRPHALALVRLPGRGPEDSGYEARLLSLSGRVLHKWTSDNRFRISFAALIERPADVGGGRLAVLGFDENFSTPYAGSLCAFDVEGDLELPIWTNRISQNDILPHLVSDRDSTAVEYGVHRGWVFDVFPEEPGDELIIIFCRGIYSQRVIRIYGLRGKLLYEVWHDGAVSSCHWMSGAGQLVFDAFDETLYWDKGVLREGKGNPLVVFAVRPKLGYTDGGYVRWLSRGEDDPTLAWYKYLYEGDTPADSQSGWSMRVFPPPRMHDPSRHVQVSLIYGGETKDRAVCWWNVDETGGEVIGGNGADNTTRGPRYLGDSYHINRARYPEGDSNRLPDPASFYLSDKVPPVAASRPSSQPVSPDEAAKPWWFPNRCSRQGRRPI